MTHGRQHRCLCDQPPVKTLGADALELTNGPRLTRAVAARGWEVQLILRDPIRRGPWVSLGSAPGIFSFAGFALYPGAVVNHSLEYNYMLNPLRPLINLWNLGWPRGP